MSSQRLAVAPVLPDNAPFTPAQRSWLNGFFAGVLSLDGGLATIGSPLADACLLAPVLHPPSLRVFDDERTFAFANPAAIVPPRASVEREGPSDKVSQGELQLLPRLAAVVGADEALAGWTLFADWRRTGLAPPKDRDFALGLGPVLTGMLSDIFKGMFVSGGTDELLATAQGLKWSLIVMMCVNVWSAIHYSLAARSLRQDAAKAAADMAAV